MLSEGVANHDPVVQVHEARLVRALKTVSISFSNVAATLQWPKDKTVKCHAVFSLS